MPNLCLLADEGRKMARSALKKATVNQAISFLNLVFFLHLSEKRLNYSWRMPATQRKSYQREKLL